MSLKIFTNGEVLFDTDLNQNFAFLNNTKLNSVNPQLGTFTETVEETGDAAASLTVDLTDAPMQKFNIIGTTTISFAGKPGQAGQARSALLLLSQDETGGHEVVWPAGIKWFGLSEPSEWAGNQIVAVTVIATLADTYAFVSQQIV